MLLPFFITEHHKENGRSSEKATDSNTRVSIAVYYKNLRSTIQVHPYDTASACHKITQSVLPALSTVALLSNKKHLCFHVPNKQTEKQFHIGSARL
jgi:hypothetical protein